MGSEKWPYLPGKTSFHTPLTDVCICVLKEHSTFFLKIGSFYTSPRDKQLSFIFFFIHSVDPRV